MSTSTSVLTGVVTDYINAVGDIIFGVVPVLVVASVALFGLFFAIRYGIKWLRKALGGKV